MLVRGVQGVSRPDGRLRRPASRILGRLGLVPRLMLLYGLVLSLALTVVLVVVGQLFAGQLARSLDNDLSEEIPEFSAASSQRPVDQPIAVFAQQYVQTHTLARGAGLIIEIAGSPTARSSGALQGVPQIGTWLAHPPASTVLTTVAFQGHQYRLLASPIVVAGRPDGVLIASASLTGLNTQARDAMLVTGMEAAAALLITLVGTYLVLRRVLHTVDRVTVAANAITHERLGLRLGYTGADDEVGRLARTFDDMLGRIEQAFLAQRQLLSETSHQLRTPLTVIRGHLEVLRRGGYQDPAETEEAVALVLDELTRTVTLVDQLLLLGRSLEPGSLDVDDVDLRSFMADIFAAAQTLAPRRWSLGSVPDAVVLVDQAKLRGALLNLVDNAVKATTPDDFIALDATCDGEIVLAVSDGGQGIPPEDQARLFERFVRSGDSSSRGAGLGLAIVRAVAEAHGGRASLESTPGIGTVVRVVLPGSRLVALGGAADGTADPGFAGAHRAAARGKRPGLPARLAARR
jgi:two-component system OmpR family sensor kinase